MSEEQIDYRGQPENGSGAWSSCLACCGFETRRDTLGMDKNRFNRAVRPWVTAIPIGGQGIAFDRLDLNAWVNEHKRVQRTSSG